MSGYITMSQAHQLTGIHKDLLFEMVGNRTLRATSIDRRVFVCEADLAPYLNSSNTEQKSNEHSNVN